MRVLVTTPDLQKTGGVASYYAAIRGHLPRDVEYFAVGSGVGTEGPARTAVRLLRGYGRFLRTLVCGGHALVHLNPSLGWNALARDAVALRMAMLLGKKTLVFFRGWDPRVERKLTGARLWLLRHTLLRADAVVVLAREFVNKLQLFGYRGLVFTETTVFDEELLQGFDVENRREKARSSLRLLFLARVVKDKGIYETLDAYRLLREKSWPVSLVVAGDGPELPAAREYVRAKGIPEVKFLGDVRGKVKAAVYREADIFLFPSSHEGMPNAIVEAMAFGLPVITCPVGGIPDFFEHGKMGFLTESRAPEVLAGLLEKLLGDQELRLSMGRFNHQFARERFAASQVAARLERIYRIVLRGETEAPSR